MAHGIALQKFFKQFHNNNFCMNADVTLDYARKIAPSRRLLLSGPEKVDCSVQALGK